MSRADLWICAQRDVTSHFLEGLKEPMVITCMDKSNSEIKGICDEHGYEYVWFNPGFHKTFTGGMDNLLYMVKEHLDRGFDVVVHCRAGLHRAATVVTILNAHFRSISFMRSLEELREIREVEVEDFIARHPGPHFDKWNEDVCPDATLIILKRLSLIHI